MHLKVYEPTVMFFGLTNLLVIFQVIINDIRATKVKLLEEFSENRMRLLEGYSILYIQVSLAIEYPKDQNQD